MSKASQVDLTFMESLFREIIQHSMIKILVSYLPLHLLGFVSFPETIIRLLLPEEGCRLLSFLESVKWTRENEVFRDFVCQYTRKF